jgi:hypothetical protein
LDLLKTELETVWFSQVSSIQMSSFRCYCFLAVYLYLNSGLASCFFYTFRINVGHQLTSLQVIPYIMQGLYLTISMLAFNLYLVSRALTFNWSLILVNVPSQKWKCSNFKLSLAYHFEISGPSFRILFN